MDKSMQEPTQDFFNSYAKGFGLDSEPRLRKQSSYEKPSYSEMTIEQVSYLMPYSSIEGVHKILPTKQCSMLF